MAEESLSWGMNQMHSFDDYLTQYAIIECEEFWGDEDFSSYLDEEEEDKTWEPI